MSRLLSDLHPEVRKMCEHFLDECEHAGIDVLITCTWRSNAEQDALYALGRNKPGRIVTRARGGQSSHNYMALGVPASLAFDVVPMRNGKLIWGTSGDGLDQDPTDDNTDDLELWQRVGVIGKACGLKWYGDPDASFKEYPHFEHQDSVSIRRGLK